MRQRVLVTALAAGFLVLTGRIQAEPAGFVRVKVDVANVRERPTAKSDALDQAYENDPLQVLGERGRWLRVRDFEGDEGWVYAPLTDGTASVIVNAPVANLRAGPGMAHDVLYTADRGAAFVVHRRKGPWLEVQHADGARGWIHASLLWGRR